MSARNLCFDLDPIDDLLGGVRMLDEEGNPFSLWDGITVFKKDVVDSLTGLIGVYNGNTTFFPSLHSTSNVTVYGDGSLYCIKLKRDQAVELMWRWKRFRIELAGMGISGSVTASSTGSGHYEVDNPTGFEGLYPTYKWVADSDSSLTQDLLAVNGGASPDEADFYNIPDDNTVALSDITFCRQIDLTENKLCCPSTDVLSKDSGTSAWSEWAPGENASFSDGLTESSPSDSVARASASCGGVTAMRYGYSSFYMPDLIKISDDEYWWNPSIEFCLEVDVSANASQTVENPTTGSHGEPLPTTTENLASLSCHIIWACSCFNPTGNPYAGDPNYPSIIADAGAVIPQGDWAASGGVIEQLPLEIHFSTATLTANRFCALFGDKTKTDTHGGASSSYDFSTIILPTVKLIPEAFFTYGGLYDGTTGEMG